jgi:autotransporter passenger strand-loop-strand repeat protein
MAWNMMLMVWRNKYAAITSVISSGQTVDGLVVSSGMSIRVHDVLNSANVNFSGTVYVLSGGTANNIMVNSGNWACGLKVYDGGQINNTTLNSGGELVVFSGGTASNTTVNKIGSLSVSSGGMANNTTVNGGGYIDVFRDGTADGTTVNSRGTIFIHSGGTASEIIISSGGSVFFTIASDTYIQGISNGSTFEIKTPYYSLTYQDGENSVKVSGVAAENISPKFGDDGSEQYG